MSPMCPEIQYQRAVASEESRKRNSPKLRWQTLNLKKPTTNKQTKSTKTNNEGCLPQAIIGTILLIRQSPLHKHMVHTSFSKFNKLNIRTTSSRHPNIISLKVGKLRKHVLHNVQSELTIRSWGFNQSLKMCIPKFKGKQCDKLTKA
jgi:hypothetical protein